MKVNSEYSNNFDEYLLIVVTQRIYLPEEFSTIPTIGWYSVPVHDFPSYEPDGTCGLTGGA